MSTEEEIEICGLRLRPFSLGTRSLWLKLAPLLGISDEMNALGEHTQVVALAWIQSASLADVRRAIRDGSAMEAIEAFELGVPVVAFPKLRALIAAQAAEIEAVSVEVIPRPGGSGETAPPN